MAVINRSVKSFFFYLTEKFILVLMFSQESKLAYVDDEDPRNAGWSQDVPQETELWVSGLFFSALYRV